MECLQLLFFFLLVLNVQAQLVAEPLKYEQYMDLGKLDDHYSNNYMYYFQKPAALYAKGNDNLYYADWNVSVIYKIDLTTNPPQKTVFAGILNAPGGELSDNGQATDARIREPYLVINPVRDEVYIANSFNHTIQKVNGNGIISHLGGRGCESRYSYVDYYTGKTVVYCWANVYSSENGNAATNAYLGDLRGMAVSTDGNTLYTTENNYIRKIDLQQNPPTISAGGGTNTWTYQYPDNVQMSTAELAEPKWLAVANLNNIDHVYFTERIYRNAYNPNTAMWEYWEYHQIRKWNTQTGIVNNFMGFDGGANYNSEWNPNALQDQPTSKIYINHVEHMTTYNEHLYVFTNYNFKVNLNTETVVIFVPAYEFKSVAWLTNGDAIMMKLIDYYYDGTTGVTIEDKLDLIKLSECPAGSICQVYEPYQVIPCEPGTIDIGGHECVECEANTFNEEAGNTKCTVCPAGRVSGVIGSDTVDNCVNPTPNFVIGYLSIGLLVFIVFQYVVNGRFHRIAFIRKFRGMSLIFFEAKNCSHALAILVEKHIVLDELSVKHTGCFRYLKVFLWLFCTTFMVGVIMIVAYVLTLSKVFFQSLLIYRGFEVDNLGFVEKMEALAESLSWVGNLFYPFLWMIEQISFFKIDLNTVEVTCKGAQAPMELLINCCVLGFTVFIVESDFHLYANTVFAQMNLKFVKGGSNFQLGLENVKDLVLKCIIFYVIATSNPLIKILQFTMSILQFGVFVEDGGRHASTKSCNDPDSVGYEGLDEALATISTLLAYFILFPTIYTVSKVVLPHGDAFLLSEEHLKAIKELDDKKDDKIYDKKKEDTSDKISEYNGKVCPDIYQDKLSQNEFKNAVRLFDKFDDDGGGRIEEEEMIDHFYHLGLVGSAEKTAEFFEKADVDHSREIDFVEFLDFMCRIRVEDRVEFNFLMESTEEKTSCIQAFKGAAKLSTFLSPDVLLASVFIWWLNKLCDQLGGRSRFNYKDVLMCSYKKQTPDEYSEWKKHLTRGLPPYHVLCQLIANAIKDYFCCCDCCGIFSNFLYVIAFFPPVHLFTSIGRSIWYIVYRKYCSYVMACLGIWMDSCVEGYDLENHSKICISEDIDASDDKMNDHDETSEQDIIIKMQNMRHEDFTPQKNHRKIDSHQMGEVVRMIVAPRALLLQVIPQLTPISVYAEIMADSPLFVFSKKAKPFFSDFLIRNPLQIARVKEMKEANHTLTAAQRGVEWVVRLRAANVYVTESRLFKIVKNLFLFLFSLGVLYSNPEWWVSISMILLFPFLFISLLDVYVMTGKFFGITDDDVSICLPTHALEIPDVTPDDYDESSVGEKSSEHPAQDSMESATPTVRAAPMPEIGADLDAPRRGQNTGIQLASLASLLKQGIIDDEHFERAKASLTADL